MCSPRRLSPPITDIRRCRDARDNGTRRETHKPIRTTSPKKTRELTNSVRFCQIASRYDYKSNPRIRSVRRARARGRKAKYTFFFFYPFSFRRDDFKRPTRDFPRVADCLTTDSKHLFIFCARRRTVNDRRSECKKKTRR